MLSHRDIKIVGQYWNLEGVNNLESFRKSIIRDADRWAKQFEDNPHRGGIGCDCQNCQCNWFKGACFEIWGEFFVAYFGNNPKVDFSIYNAIPHVEDRGVDGWGLNNNRENATVQFKFKSDPTHKVTYEELAKFKDQSREDYNVSKNENMVVITTTYGFNDIATGQARGVRCLGWDQLKDIIESPGPNQKFWDDFRDTYDCSSRLSKRTYKTPFPHQSLMYRKITDFLISSEDRGYVLCGTGGGKTLVMSLAGQWYLSQEGQQVIVIASPRIQLSNQIAKMFWDEKSGEWDWITFHSGHGVEVEAYADTHDEGSTIEEEEEKIRKMGGAATLDLDRVVAFLTDNRDKIVYTTYHSSERLLERLNKEGINFIYFGDECHNLVTSKFSHVLDRSKVSIQKFIGFTATIETTTDPNDVGMNNYIRWGKCIIEITPAQLVSLGITLPPRVFTAEIKATGQEENIELTATGQMIRQFKDRVRPNSDCRIIVNCSSCHIAHNLVDEGILKEYLPEFEVCVVTSYAKRMGARTRDTELEKFRNAQNAVIVHYSMLGEGIDVPGVTGILAWRELSVRDLLQLFGRAVRITVNDRVKLQEETIKIGDEKGWEKPYAYILAPKSKSCLELETVYNNMIRVLNRLRNKERCIACYVHGAESKGSEVPSIFPRDRTIERGTIDCLDPILEPKDEVNKIYHNMSADELLKQIEEDVGRIEAEEIVLKSLFVKRDAHELAVVDISLTEEEVAQMRVPPEQDF